MAARHQETDCLNIVNTMHGSAVLRQQHGITVLITLQMVHSSSSVIGHLSAGFPLNVHTSQTDDAAAGNI